MNEKNKKMELLGSTPVPRALLALGLPTMIGMMINALYNLVDAYFVGGLGTSQMGAITIAYPLGQVVVGLGLLFGNGAASYLSRLLGRGDKKTADQAASTALYRQHLCRSRSHPMFPAFPSPAPQTAGSHGKHHAVRHNLYGHLYSLFYFQCI